MIVIHSDDVERVLVEIVTGKRPATADTPALAALRRQLQRECDDIVARGGVVEIPHEIPEVGE